MNISIIYEDDNIVVLNKPAGLLVHPTPNHLHSTLVNWLLQHYPSIKSVGDDPGQRPGIVHRLDRDTSGIILAAKNQKAFDYFKSQFKNRTIKKTYLAIVKGKVKDQEGIIDKPIGIKSGTTRRSTHSGKMAKLAITEYRLLKHLVVAGQDLSLLEVRPLTGRTHQIRVHLASIGYPILGDPLYGKADQASRLFLHALSLEFINLDGTPLRLESDPPEDFKVLY